MKRNEKRSDIRAEHNEGYASRRLEQDGCDGEKLGLIRANLSFDSLDFAQVFFVRSSMVLQVFFGREQNSILREFCGQCLMHPTQRMSIELEADVVPFPSQAVER